MENDEKDIKTETVEKLNSIENHTKETSSNDETSDDQTSELQFEKSLITPIEKKVDRKSLEIEIQPISQANEIPVSDAEEQTRPFLVRRNTIVEETEESLRQARKSIALENSRKNSMKDNWIELKKDIYNPNFREFMGRDALAWFKLSLFYFIFYVVLATFFILLLLLFYEFKIDLKTPSLFYKESVMHYKGINPGLGFRPQVDVETELIRIDVNQTKINLQSIELFLDKYERNKLKNFTGAHGRIQQYIYDEYLKGTPCSRENNFGFYSQAPCIIVKLNRIYGWLPKVSAKTPGNLTKVLYSFIFSLTH